MGLPYITVYAPDVPDCETIQGVKRPRECVWGGRLLEGYTPPGNRLLADCNSMICSMWYIVCFAVPTKFLDVGSQRQQLMIRARPLIHAWWLMRSWQLHHMCTWLLSSTCMPCFHDGMLLPTTCTHCCFSLADHSCPVSAWDSVRDSATETSLLKCRSPSMLHTAHACAHVSNTATTVMYP